MHEQGFGSGLILTGSGSNLSGQTASVLKIFHLFYDDYYKKLLPI